MPEEILQNLNEKQATNYTTESKQKMPASELMATVHIKHTKSCK
jgi:hypothetical protein